ncbi:MAG: MFS transporter [Acetobacteraceae bacterium]
MFAASIAPWLARRGIHYGWVMVGLTFLTTVCSSAAIGMPGVLILPISQEFGWGRGDVSGAMALMLVLYGGMAPFAGALLRRYGVRRMVAIASFTAVLGLLGATQMSARWHLWISMGLVLGIAVGTTALVLSATVASRWFTHRRGLVIGVLTAAMAAGQLLFLPTAAYLATNHGWRTAVLPAMIGCAVSAVMYLLFARDWPADIGLAPYGETRIQPPAPASAGNAIALSVGVLREASATRAFWVLAGTFFICGLSTAGTVQQHFIPFCADNGVTAVRAASVLALMGVFNFVGTVASGWLSDRFDNRVLLAWYYGLRGLSLMWLPFGNFDLLSLSVFAVFFGLDFIATVPPTVKLSAQHFGPDKAPIVFGWAFASHQLGGAVAAFATGLSRDLLMTYLPAFFTAGVACLFAALSVFVLRQVRPAVAQAAE